MTDEKTSLDAIYESLNDEERRKALLALLVDDHFRGFLKNLEDTQHSHSDKLSAQGAMLSKHADELYGLWKAVDRNSPQVQAGTETNPPSRGSDSTTENVAVKSLADVNRVTNSTRPSGRQEPVRREISDYRKNQRPKPVQPSDKE